MNFSQEELVQLVEQHGPWFHNIEFPHGIFTNPSHPTNPRGIWEDVSKVLPQNMNGMRVLDAGCNGGFMEIQLENLGCQVDAFDINPIYVKQTTFVKQVFDLHCNVFEADMAKGSEYFSGPYDMVFLLGVIYHVDDMISVLRNSLALTKGPLVIESAICKSKESVIEFMNWEGAYLNRFVPSALALTKMIQYVGGKVTNSLLRCDGGRIVMMVAKE